MPSFYFLVRCPGCGHKMKYHTDTRVLSGKRKKCVFCPKSFLVKENLVMETQR